MTERPPLRSTRAPRSRALSEPTLAEVSEQVAGVAASVSGLTQQTIFLGQRVGGLGDRLEDAEARLGGQIGDVREHVRVLHTEMALLRTTQVADHAPRLLAVEQRSPVQKAGAAGAWALRGTVYFTFLSVLARIAAKKFPEFEGAINEVLGALGQ